MIEALPAEGLGDLWRCANCGWLWEASAGECSRCSHSQGKNPAAVAGVLREPTTRDDPGAFSLGISPQPTSRSGRGSPKHSSRQRAAVAGVNTSHMFVEQFGLMPPHRDGALFGRTFGLDMSLPDHGIFPDSESGDPSQLIKMMKTDGYKNKSGDGSHGSPQANNGARGQNGSGFLGNHQPGRQQVSAGSNLPSISGPNAGSFMSPPKADGALFGTHLAQDRAIPDNGVRMSKSKSESILSSSNGFRQKQKHHYQFPGSPSSGTQTPMTRPQSGAITPIQYDRAMPGEPILTPGRMGMPGTSDRVQTSTQSRSHTPTGKTNRSIGLFDTGGSLQDSGSMAAWAKEYDNGREFAPPTPAKWLPTLPVDTRIRWGTGNSRVRPGGAPLNHSGEFFAESPSFSSQR